MKKDFIKRFLFSFRKKRVVSGGEASGSKSEEVALNTEEKADQVGADLAKIVGNEEEKSVEADAAKIGAIPEPQEERIQILAKQSLICIGEYPAKVLAEGQLPCSNGAVQPVFIDRSSEEEIKWGKGVLDTEKITGLDANVDTQFWYQVTPYFAENKELFERIRSKLKRNEFGVLMVSSLWDGIGSAMSPTLISKLKEWDINTVTLALSPSKLQPSAAHFNALSSIGMCLANESAALVLVDRDQLNRYVGVDRSGSIIRGNMVLNSIIQMMLARPAFVNEFSEISRSFGVKTFTILAATGASLKIYGSLENILGSTVFRSLHAFDLSGSSLLYVLVRLPNLLKEELSRDKIELIIAGWFKDKAALKSVYVAEPLYVEDANDRVDMLMLVGGFGLEGMLAKMKKKAEAVKTQAIKKGLMKEEEWKDTVKSIA